MATRHSPHNHSHDKENACDFPPPKTAKLMEKDKKPEINISGTI